MWKQRIVPLMLLQSHILVNFNTPVKKRAILDSGQTRYQEPNNLGNLSYGGCILLSSCWPAKIIFCSFFVVRNTFMSTDFKRNPRNANCWHCCNTDFLRLRRNPLDSNRRWVANNNNSNISFFYCALSMKWSSKHYMISIYDTLIQDI